MDQYNWLLSLGTKEGTKKLSLCFASVLQREYDGTVKSSASALIDLLLLNKILEEHKRIPQPNLQSLSNVLQTSIQYIQEYLEEKISVDIRKFKVFENMSIGCIICRQNALELIIVFVNQKCRDFGVHNVLNKGLTEVMKLQPLMKLESFVVNRLPTISVRGRFLNNSIQDLFQLQGYWMSKYAVFNIVKIN